MLEKKVHFPCFEPQIIGLANQRNEWHLESFEVDLLDALITEFMDMLFAFDSEDTRDFWKHRFAAEEIYKRLRNTRS